MTAKHVEDLYDDNEFDEYIVTIARKSLLDYDELKQEIFLSLTEATERTHPECRLIADKVCKRMKRKQMRESTVSLDELIENGYDLSDYEADQRSIRYHDNTHLGKQDLMTAHLVNTFQPKTTIDVYRGKLIINGEC